MRNQNETSSDALMAHFQKTLDEDVFEQIVGRFLTPALAVARGFLADATAADDAAQEAFLRVVRRRGQYRPSRSFANWFYAILRNVCKDMLRRRGRQMRALQDFAANRDRRPAAAPPADSAGELLARLPQADRTVLLLRIVEQLPFRDVAAAMGISQGAAKKRAQRALRRLRKLTGLAAVRSPPRDEFPRRAVPELARPS